MIAFYSHVDIFNYLSAVIKDKKKCTILLTGSSKEEFLKKWLYFLCNFKNAKKVISKKDFGLIAAVSEKIASSEVYFGDLKLSSKIYFKNGKLKSSCDYCNQETVVFFEGNQKRI